MRSAVSATIADGTPGIALTASSARFRTGSQACTTPASTVIEKNTLPSLATMSDSVPVFGSGVPSGAATLPSAASTSSLVTGMFDLYRFPRRFGVTIVVPNAMVNAAPARY